MIGGLEERLKELTRLSRELFGKDLSGLKYDTLYVAHNIYRRKGKTYVYLYLYGEVYSGGRKKKERIVRLSSFNDKVRDVISLYRACKLLKKALYYDPGRLLALPGTTDQRRDAHPSFQNHQEG